MPIIIPQVATTVVATLAPFTPYLIEVGKSGGKKLAELIGEKGGEGAWNTAQALWTKLKDQLGADPEFQSAATMVAANPEDESRQTMFAEVMGARLQDDPQFAQELFDLMGGQEAVAQVRATRGSWVEDVTQKIEGDGQATVEADDRSTIVGVSQEIKK